MCACACMCVSVRVHTGATLVDTHGCIGVCLSVFAIVFRQDFSHLSGLLTSVQAGTKPSACVRVCVCVCVFVFVCAQVARNRTIFGGSR